MTLTPDLIWFRGHFPDQPVLPGIAQVHMAAQWAERLWDWKPAGANLSQLKFRRILIAQAISSRFLSPATSSVSGSLSPIG